MPASLTSVSAPARLTSPGSWRTFAGLSGGAPSATAPMSGPSQLRLCMAPHAPCVDAWFSLSLTTIVRPSCAGLRWERMACNQGCNGLLTAHDNQHSALPSVHSENKQKWTAGPLHPCCLEQPQLQADHACLWW
eukprot:361401-Chlamydomonas_euryale.AAC.9